MADAVISGLVKDLLGRLTSEAIQEYGLLRRLKDDLLKLSGYLSQTQAVLKDAEENRRSEEAVELWLKSLRSASLKMENVLDEVSTEAMLQKLYKELGMKHRFRAFFSCDHNPLMFRIRVAHKVKTIKTQFDDITVQIPKFDLIHRAVVNHVDGGISGGIPDRETSSLINSSTVFGRKEEVKRVTEKICNPHLGKNEDDDIRVYAIWGMGGLGKTTLAKLVYNDERVKGYFDFRCWIYVSQNFQVKELIKRIIESIDKKECTLSQLDELQKGVQEKLRGKRFLVVLDDVWTEDSEKWEQLSETLSCGAEGSIVVLTTRSNGTIQMTAKVLELQHELGCLSQEDSWLLFKKFAFAGGRAGEDITEFERIGKEIVEKCKGLPLALKTLGGLMRLKSKLNEWQHVRDDIWNLPENNILPTLKLSYDNLPPHVKRCFAYCCMLPKGHEMGKDLLIWLWKANRLIPSTGEADWYVLGEEILNCLVWRSFFQVVDNKYNGNEYKMHDLMHDLARSVMGNDCSIIEPGKDNLIVPDEVLHLSLSCPDFASLQQKFKMLRSVFIFAKEDYKGIVSHIFDQVYLRVVYLDKIGLETLPESICKLKHLRYLNLSNSRIKVLPESIVDLQNLQLLNLSGCMSLQKLPKRMRNMRNLQYLDISYSTVQYLPVGIGELTGLRSLTAFSVPENDGAQIGELGSLNLIGPYLKIEGLDRVKGGLREAQSANLKSKRNLLVLELDWYDSSRTVHDDDEEVLEGLEPNPSLEKLGIFQYMGKNISPSWMVNLRSLVQIQFYGCVMCEDISPLGKLPSLRVIRLWFMDSLKCLDDDDNILFPQLQVLKIICCEKLKILPGSLPELKKLTLVGCNELVSLPGNLPELKKLKLQGCKKLVSLPGNLTKLEVLDLLTYEDLVSLPDEIRNFKYLNTLKIRGSENLIRRYAKDIGEDWPKISHIPNISITKF